MLLIYKIMPIGIDEINGMEKIYLEWIVKRNIKVSCVIVCTYIVWYAMLCIYWLKLIDISCLPNDPT